MGRSKKYATEEEAREAKKKQMREAYERRRKLVKDQVKAARSKSEEKPNTIQTEPVVIDEKPKRKLKISEKAELLDRIQQLVTEFKQ